jgi:hypothetical protein
MSPWCSGDFYLLRQFPEMHTRSPAGVRAAAHLPHATAYGPTSHTGATIHAWRPGHWYTWMFNVSEATEPSTGVDTWTLFSDVNAIFGKVPTPRANTSDVTYLGAFSSRDGCWAGTRRPRATNPPDCLLPRATDQALARLSLAR